MLQPVTTTTIIILTGPFYHLHHRIFWESRGLRKVTAPQSGTGHMGKP
jgi:hypothetical protein